MKLVRLALLTTIAAPLITSTLAHPFGGSHSPPVPPPPVGGPPPPNTGPGDTLTPRGGGGGRQTTPSGPSTPGPTGPAAPGANGPPPPATPAASAIVDLSDWSWWWNFNRDPYLDLKRSVLGGSVQTGSDDFFLGRGQEASGSSRLPDERAIRELVGPALQRGVESGSSQVQSDALIAIAKLHPLVTPEGKSMVELISQHLTAANQKTAESAIVALGLMGESRNIRILADIAADNEAGREVLNRPKVPGRTRPLAVLALGVLSTRLEHQDARRMVIGRLSALLNEDEGAYPDLHVACVTAIGLAPLPEAGITIEEKSKRRLSPMSNLESEVHFLLGLLQDDKRHEVVRAHIPKAVALLTREASKGLRDIAKHALLEELEALKRRDRLVRYGIVEALGMLGDSDGEEIDAQVREALHTSVRDGDNSQRGLSLIAIALASSRRGESGEPFAALEEERAYLLKQLERGKSRLRPWTALALGLQGYHANEERQRPSDAVVDALLRNYEDTRSAADAGAYGIAMGLLGDPRAFDEILDRVENTGDDDARGFAAVGLGLLGSFDAIAPLEAVVRDSRVRHIPLHKAAIALALLGEKDIVTAILENLAGAKSAEVTTAQIVVLGEIGDNRVLKPLVGVLDDPKQLDNPRGYAATSLGIVCETESIPWPANFTNHMNYFATTETLISGKGTGLLNLR